MGSVSWSPDSLFLACVLKRGSLLMLARLGGLLTLTTTGCNIDFGPAHFLPLHPLVTYRYTYNYILLFNYVFFLQVNGLFVCVNYYFYLTCQVKSFPFSYSFILSMNKV